MPVGHGRIEPGSNPGTPGGDTWPGTLQDRTAHTIRGYDRAGRDARTIRQGTIRQVTTWRTTNLQMGLTDMTHDYEGSPAHRAGSRRAGTPTRGRASLCALGILTLTGLTGLAGPAAAAEPTPPAAAGPQLSIALDDARTSAAEGDDLGYTITVTNLGTEPIEGLRVSQRLPAGTTFVSADQDGTQDGDAVVWTQDLAASGVFTAQLSATVGAPVAGDLRLASVVCAAVAADQPPLVCASDSDQLPAGAEVEAAQAAAASSTGATTANGSPRWWWFAGGAGVLGLAGAAVAVVHRRRTRTVVDPRAEPADTRLPVS